LIRPLQSWVTTSNLPCNAARAVFVTVSEIDPATTPFHGSSPSNLHLPAIESPDWFNAIVISVSARETFQIPSMLTSSDAGTCVTFIDELLADAFCPESAKTFWDAIINIRASNANLIHLTLILEPHVTIIADQANKVMISPNSPLTCSHLSPVLHKAKKK
jgi:hypothetical protein